MTRTGRLDSAKATGWVQSYQGKDLVRGYCKCFAVDPLCAVIELRQLGVQISQDLETHVRKLVEQRAEARRTSNRENAREREDLPDSDETYAFIAGYTPGGLPFGVTWEEYLEPPLRD